MCEGCLVETRPNRGKTVLDGGTFLINFKSCARCAVRAVTVVKNRNLEEDDVDSETLTFNRSFLHFICIVFTNFPEDHCRQCDHLVAQHFWSFYVVDGVQEYVMDCALCGHGANSVRIHPIVLQNADQARPNSQTHTPGSAAVEISASSLHALVRANALPARDEETGEWE